MVTVMNSTLQGLWLGCILERNLGIFDKQEIMTSPAIWHDTPGEYFECTRKLTATKAIKTNNSMAFTG
jgi:hypothetical protein